jgi:hypothetical protein
MFVLLEKKLLKSHVDLKVHLCLNSDKEMTNQNLGVISFKGYRYT